MQLSNVMVRLGGLLTNTVPKVGVTPAEILILRHIHGQESVVDIRPTGFDKRRRNDTEYERLAQIYDRGAGTFVGSPGEEENRSVMARLFPGAMKKLPTTLEDIGITGAAPAEPQAVVEPAPDADEELADDDAENGDDEGEDGGNGGAEAPAA
jgi:hypothetical protein